MCHRQRQYEHVASNTSTRVTRQLQSVQRMGPQLGPGLGAVKTMADEYQHTFLVNGPQPSDTADTNPTDIFQLVWH